MIDISCQMPRTIFNSLFGMESTHIRVSKYVSSQSRICHHHLRSLLSGKALVDNSSVLGDSKILCCQSIASSGVCLSTSDSAQRWSSASWEGLHIGKNSDVKRKENWWLLRGLILSSSCLEIHMASRTSAQLEQLSANAKQVKLHPYFLRTRTPPVLILTVKASIWFLKDSWITILT